MSLSVLCVSSGDNHSRTFVRKLRDMTRGLQAEFVLVAHGDQATERFRNWALPPTGTVHSQKPWVESVLETALTFCSGSYILRMDDDELCSPAMVVWLAMEEYKKADHWKFPRTHYWNDLETVLMTPQLFPDHQTRLSLRHKAGGRTEVHAGSPFGGGSDAQVAIEHYKFLVKSYDERRRIAMNYDSFRRGYGTNGMLAFSLPEDAYPGGALAASAGDGTIPWNPAWRRVIELI